MTIITSDTFTDNSYTVTESGEKIFINESFGKEAKPFEIFISQGKEAIIYCACDALTSLNLSIILSDQASVIFRGLFYLEHQAVFQGAVTITHRGVESHSQMFVRGVGSDTSFGSFFGKVVIEKESVRSTTYVSERALLLSPLARISMKPDLVIHTKYVEARHEATISHLDDEHVLYLLSRGFERDEAAQIVINGFLNAEHVHWPKDLVEKVHKTTESYEFA